MESQTVILPLAILLAILFQSAGAYAATFTIKNNCPFTVWPGILTGGGKPQITTTGFELLSKASKTIDITVSWSGRFWGRTGCTTDATGRLVCATGDCASGQVTCNGAGGIPPTSLAEVFLAEKGGTDFYDISLVDGFNVPVSISPRGGTKPSGGPCVSTSCGADVNAGCPPELAVRGHGGGVIACKSACTAFNKPQYCCTGAYGSPRTCHPSHYSLYFKGKCPEAYSYAYDDPTSTYTCVGGTANYAITFCPKNFH
ncbi:thaumatin-like protein 1 [Tripterygium wilfordii]|uniref:Thaumatin-like protein 1 n=1 Tax=Tripterygium wilfordii TaxID=458696 RepID=A0A7J7DVP1_TRIWF|nr:thaumatin-like protein 1 [Tripterygium wilfordii]KAF5750440.1 thaumatin-like protein 1 [Tripterygium wilfordii]